MGLALEAELLEDLQALYERHGSSVTVHELPMPAVLRDGIGTHWMIPKRLEFSNPEDKDEHRSLSTEEVLGLVRGNTVRSRQIGRNILAAMRGVVGGEVPEYTKLMAECREQALDRMMEEARHRGADAIVGLRFASSEVMEKAAEILVYGTAVKLR